MAWTIEYSETAEKQLARLDKPIARRIVDYMNKRVAPKSDPRSTGKALTGQFSSLWRYRVGEFRVICEIQDNALRVLVAQIGDRKEVYKRK